MSHDYKTVQWTPFKKIHDLVLLAGVAVFLAAYVGATLIAAPAGQSHSEIQLLIRAFGAAAFALLNVILLVGPLARLSPRFLPLLYNRRHLGVTCFALALVHATLVVIWYHGFSDVSPLISLLVSNPRYESIQGFPFESLGLAALLILFLLAATSHDFWNANLGPGVWKAIHMSVYVAYALLVAHVMLGVVQAEKNLVYAAVVGFGALLVAGFHLYAGRREADRDTTIASPKSGPEAEAEGWLSVCAPADIPDGRARIVTPPRGERIAVFRDGQNIHAVSNVCRHQGGPLGEGRILDGCVTCPWHGFQYRVADGCAPAPYSEKIATYRTRLVDGVVFVHPAAAPPGTPIPPSLIPPEPA